MTARLSLSQALWGVKDCVRAAVEPLLLRSLCRMAFLLSPCQGFRNVYAVFLLQQFMPVNFRYMIDIEPFGDTVIFVTNIQPMQH